jgi:hypothetical protein
MIIELKFKRRLNQVFVLNKEETWHCTEVRKELERNDGKF